jgi:hypothetical protein
LYKLTFCIPFLVLVSRVYAEPPENPHGYTENQLLQIRRHAKKGDFTDMKEKQRVSIYLDSELVRRADAMRESAGCSSRNEFVAAALENYIADLTVDKRGDILCEKLAGAIEKAVDYEAVKISKGLFRYAVELDVIMQMLAACWDVDPKQLEKFRREAVNNVRRTRGKVRLDELFLRKDTASL